MDDPVIDRTGQPEEQPVQATTEPITVPADHAPRVAGAEGHEAAETEAVHSIKRRLIEHGLIALFMGVFVAIVLASLSPLSPLRLMEFLGADAVADEAARLAESGTMWKPPIIFVTIDDATMARWRVGTSLAARGEIGRLTSLLRHSKAKVVVLDVTFERIPLDQADNEALRQAFEGGGAPLVLAAPLARSFQGGQQVYEALLPGGAYPQPLPPGVSFAASFLSRNVVRSQNLNYCVFVPHLGPGAAPAWMLMPSVAEEVRRLVTGQAASSGNCPGYQAPPASAVFLIPPERGSAAALRPLSWFRTISATDVAQATGLLDGAIVVVGQDNGVVEDTHQTPLGPMAGALVHANLINSLIRFGSEEEPAMLPRVRLELLLISIGSVLEAVLYWGVVEWARRARHQGGWRYLPDFLIFLLDIVWFVAVTVFIGMIVTAVMIWVGAHMLFSGIMVGSLLPVFAVVVEALVHLGHRLYEWLHTTISAVLNWIIRCWKGGIAGAAVLLLLACLPQAARAAPAQAVGYLRVVQGSAQDVMVTRSDGKSVSGASVYEVYPDDTIMVETAGTIARVYLYQYGPAPDDIVLNHSYVVQKSTPPERGRPLFHSLAQLWNDILRAEESGPGIAGATQAGFFDLQMLMGKDRQPQAIALLKNGTFTIALDAVSVPVLWRGGTGPFRVGIDDPRPGETTRMTTTHDVLTLPVRFRQAGDKRVVRVLDLGSKEAGGGGSMTIELVAVANASVPEQGGERNQKLPAAAWLVEESQPEWRLEGLRRMQALSEGGNAEASALVKAVVASSVRFVPEMKYEALMEPDADGGKTRNGSVNVGNANHTTATQMDGAASATGSGTGAATSSASHR